MWIVYTLWYTHQLSIAHNARARAPFSFTCYWELGRLSARAGTTIKIPYMLMCKSPFSFVQCTALK